MGIIQMIGQGIIIIPGKPDQTPQKYGYYQANEENDQLIPEIITFSLPRIADEFNEFGLHGEKDYTGLFILDGLVAVEGNGGFLNPKPHLIFYFDGHRGILDLNDPAMDPANGNDLLAFLKRFPEFLLILGTFHLGTDKEEIKDHNNE